MPEEKVLMRRSKRESASTLVDTESRKAKCNLATAFWHMRPQELGTWDADADDANRALSWLVLGVEGGTIA